MAPACVTHMQGRLLHPQALQGCTIIMHAFMIIEQPQQCRPCGPSPCRNSHLAYGSIHRLAQRAGAGRGRGDVCRLHFQPLCRQAGCHALGSGLGGPLPLESLRGEGARRQLWQGAVADESGLRKIFRGCLDKLIGWKSPARPLVKLINRGCHIVDLVIIVITSFCSDLYHIIIPRREGGQVWGGLGVRRRTEQQLLRCAPMPPPRRHSPLVPAAPAPLIMLCAACGTCPLL